MCGERETCASGIPTNPEYPKNYLVTAQGAHSWLLCSITLCAFHPHSSLFQVSFLRSFFNSPVPWFLNIPLPYVQGKAIKVNTVVQLWAILWMRILSCRWDWILLAWQWQDLGFFFIKKSARDIVCFKCCWNCPYTCFFPAMGAISLQDACKMDMYRRRCEFFNISLIFVIQVRRYFGARWVWMALLQG